MDLKNSFTYHSPFGSQPARYEALRAKAYELARMINDICPASAEATLAIRKVEEAVMWANKSIACNEINAPVDPRAIGISDEDKRKEALRLDEFLQKRKEAMIAEYEGRVIEIKSSSTDGGKWGKE